MNYLLILRPAAFSEITALARDHPDHRDEIDAALGEMSAALESDPLAAGESRGGDDRIDFYGPLGVWFRVDPAARRVLVLRVYVAAPFE